MNDQILILGSTGLLGASLTHFLKLRNYQVNTHANKRDADFNVDLTSEIDTQNFLNQINPSVIINLTGLTSVESCQENPEAAYFINTKIVENIVLWCAANSQSHLIHISTDHLYDANDRVNSKEDEVLIRNIYAISKFAAELSAIKVSSTILRTNFVGKSNVAHRESLTDWVFDAFKKSKQVYVLKDVFFNPLSIETLCEILELIIHKKPNGIFNLGSRGGLSKAEFDLIFVKKLGCNNPDFMIPICANEANFLRAPRPRNMLMNCEKIERELSITLPSIYEEIEKSASNYI